jgi:predicted nuclease of predicted toxin-antitoxin system
VKLLFDQNLSPRLVARLAASFPGSSHVALLGLDQADDADIWAYACTHGFVIVTKDSDFNEMSLMHGVPPQVVWIRRGNCSADEIEGLLLVHAPRLLELLGQTDTGVLVLF